MAEAAMAKLMSTSPENPVKHRFEEYARQIDQTNDKRERLVKSSRDVTIQSKKIIFQLHRISDKNKADVLKQAESAIRKVRQVIITRIVPELTSDDALRFHRAYSPGMQEYIEARTFLSYCHSNIHIITLEEMNAEIHADFSAKNGNEDDFDFNVVDPTDYILGLADLTGEMMRRGVATKSQSDAVTILDRLREIEHGFNVIADAKGFVHKDFRSKCEVLKQSVEKVQKSCCNRVVQMSERINDECTVDADAKATGEERQRKKLKYEEVAM